MAPTVPPSPLSPSVGARRKGGKTLPRLPLSAFSPPASGTSDAFPIAPSPSTLLPEEVVDACVNVPSGDLDAWRAQLGERTASVVLNLQGKEPSQIEEILQSVRSNAYPLPVLAVLVPLLPSSSPSDVFSPPSYLTPDARGEGSSLVPVIEFTKPSDTLRDALAWALAQGLTVNIDVQNDIVETEGPWDALEELLTRVTSQDHPGKIVISNILPPPSDPNLPIVKLLTHASYRAFQAHTAALSLFTGVFVAYRPPAWGAPVPAGADESARKERAEWKRRIKMYISPIVEAFGYQRIVYASAPSFGANTSSTASEWFSLARESFTELGVEQEAVDAVFAGNARTVFGSQS
ncbi:hypothetical protein WOLCODRAFT_138416 [Wolfiporia cocos MD-104 SS10]|uniref:Amidohydrolase-related domain-containing protein n=1 Tax=Wolfiporia cocos (strain MD-104) TaxID=742152 RepID=A0A2H3JNQ7_WOLCO|nr:hypothetical protein WOLCODRAFT_138416 [Wolfiporia cocos MD-104 SS10]